MSGSRITRSGAIAAILALILVAPLSGAPAQQNPYEITWTTALNPGSILVRNADRIWTQGPDGILENADLLVRDGRIAEIGRGLGRGHPSVRNAIERVERQVLENAPIRYQIEALSERIDTTLKDSGGESQRS